MPAENGADLATCIASARPGRVDEFGSINDPAIAEKPPHPQAADMAVRPGDPVIIVIAPSREVDGRRAHSNRGQLFDGSVDGRVLVTRSTQPLLDGCRVLIGEGIDPVTRVVMRHPGSDKDALRSTVGAAAKLTVSDSDTGRPKFKTFKPWKRGEETGAGEAPVQETERAVLNQPPDAHAAPAADGKGGCT